MPGSKVTITLEATDGAGQTGTEQARRVHAARARLHQSAGARADRAASGSRRRRSRRRAQGTAHAGRADDRAGTLLCRQGRRLHCDPRRLLGAQDGACARRHHARAGSSVADGSGARRRRPVGRRRDAAASAADAVAGADERRAAGEDRRTACSATNRRSTDICRCWRRTPSRATSRFRPNAKMMNPQGPAGPAQRHPATGANRRPRSGRPDAGDAAEPARKPAHERGQRSGPAIAAATRPRATRSRSSAT